MGRAKVTKVNIDDNAEIAARYRIRAIPALLLFKGGEVAEQLSTRSKSDIVAKLEALA